MFEVDKKYACIVADPPWPYHNPGPVGTSGLGKVSGVKDIKQVGLDQHYKMMTIDDIKNIPVGRIAADCGHLYLWTTNSFMVEAHEICKVWGFVQKTIITWLKTKEDSFSPSMKTGYYFRSATEHCLFCVRGSLRLSVDVGMPSWFYHERLPHSVKPDLFFRTVMKASPGPYLELFSRRQRYGWDGWGDQHPSSEEGFW